MAHTRTHPVRCPREGAAPKPVDVIGDENTVSGETHSPSATNEPIETPCVTTHGFGTEEMGPEEAAEDVARLREERPGYR